MGIFYLLTEIPKMGEFLGVILAFGPFLLVLTLLALSLFNLFIFFFVSPHIAINPKLRLKLPIEVFHNFNKNIFSNLILFLIGIIPLCIVVGILSWAAFMTGLNFFVKREALSVALQWFFIMIPFCVILTPAILFFFNFSVESYVLIKKKNSITT